MFWSRDTQVIFVCFCVFVQLFDTVFSLNRADCMKTSLFLSVPIKTWIQKILLMKLNESFLKYQRVRSSNFI